jgi:plastocyanin
MLKLRLPFEGKHFTRVRRPIALALIGLCGGFGILTDLGGIRPSAAAQVREIQIENYSFSPGALTVPLGTTVTWINHDETPHTIVAADNPRSFRSTGLDTDDTFSFTFSKTGTYTYFCSVHPHMTGKIIVR